MKRVLIWVGVAFAALLVIGLLFPAPDGVPAEPTPVEVEQADSPEVEDEGGLLDRMARREMDQIEDQVAADAVNQYDIAKRNGDPMDICVQAGLVAAAFLQAENESAYAEWKDVERADCAAVGL
ncbi:MAG: hypothetical protein CMM84_03800 [Rhodothermaceae bacterium]|nr:hypothetical protein [Rhodothermaceae bacterium]MBC15341.1 hypothetical protein [Rhodothermaceae bacterium]